MRAVKWLDHHVSGKQKQGVRVRCRGGSGGGGGEGKDRLMEHHMARDEDLTRGEVIASVTLMIRGIAEEDTELNGETACGERWLWC